MNWSQKCAVIIPCLNEAANIERLVRQVQTILPAVIVVDDGSSDATGRLATRAGATVVRHDQPRGKGAALNAGWQCARDLGFEWALSMDGDAQHAPGDIPAFLAAAEKGEAALVVGNRMATPKGMPWLRRQVNGWMSRQLSRVAGCALPDTQCGFRLMNLSVWSKLRIRTSHFEFESELLLAVSAAGHRIEFVPIQVIYRDETSKIRPLQDTWRWFRWWVRRGK